MPNENAKHYWDKWNHGEWISDPKLSRCHPATRGIWIDAVARMWLDGKSGELHGSVEDLAKLCRAEPADFAAAVLDLMRTETAEVVFSERSGKAVEILRDISGEGNGRQRALPPVTVLTTLCVTLQNRRMKRAYDSSATSAEKQRRYRKRKRLEKLGLDIPPEFQRRD